MSLLVQIVVSFDVFLIIILLIMMRSQYFFFCRSPFQVSFSMSLLVYIVVSFVFLIIPHYDALSVFLFL